MWYQVVGKSSHVLRFTKVAPNVDVIINHVSAGCVHVYVCCVCLCHCTWHTHIGLKNGCHASIWKCWELDCLHCKLQVGQGFNWGQPIQVGIWGWSRESFDHPQVQVINDRLVPLYWRFFYNAATWRSDMEVCINVKERCWKIHKEISYFPFWLFALIEVLQLK